MASIKKHTYSSWEFYSSNYGGQLTEGEYQKYSLGAKAAIDARTFGMAQTAPDIMAENLACCECELLDAMHAFAQVPRGVASINNDGYAISYVSRTNGQNIENEADTSEEIYRKWLMFPHNLLYGGVCLV